MARKQPIVAPMAITSRGDLNMITQVREYKLITPLFGGGVEPGEADPVTVIRASEIRGQLRFWWRATRGGQFGGSLDKMKEAEDLIWGAASKKDYERPSLVQVEVDLINLGRPEIVYAVNRCSSKGYPVADHQKKSQTLEYISFPLQPKREETDIGWTSQPVVLNIKFKVTFRFPAKVQYGDTELQISPEINAAREAWEAFGGIGARTRRGFGALCLEKSNDEDAYQYKPDAQLEACERWIRNILDACTGDWDENIPHLSPKAKFAVTKSSKTSTDAWNNLIDAFKVFRGQIDTVPHRKRDIHAIKRLLQPKATTESITNFQRATLGLPLIYQNLKGVYSKGQRIDSIKLQGKNKEQQRFASPLILRPFACRDGRYVGLAVLLENSFLPNRLELNGYDSSIDASNAKDLSVAETFIDSLKGK